MKSGCMCESVLYTRVCAKIGEKIHHVYYLCITCVLPAESHAERKIVDRCLHLQTTGVFSAVCARSKSHTTPNTEYHDSLHLAKDAHQYSREKKKLDTKKALGALARHWYTLITFKSNLGQPRGGGGEGGGDGWERKGDEGAGVW